MCSVAFRFFCLFIVPYNKNNTQKRRDGPNHIAIVAQGEGINCQGRKAQQPAPEDEGKAMTA